MIDADSSWADSLAPEVVQEIRELFELNLVGKSHDGGWPSILPVVCESCGARFLVYAGFYETPNSFFTVTLQCVVEFAG